jgi:hypothetical protein
MYIAATRDRYRTQPRRACNPWRLGAEKIWEGLPHEDRPSPTAVRETTSISLGNS